MRLSEKELSPLVALAVSAAVKAGEAIMDVYAAPADGWEVERKADDSPLTLADRRAHAVIADALAATPYPLLSEEGAHADYSVRSAWPTLWVVDPLDGTKEFIKRNGEFTVNIALVHEGAPVLGVVYVPVPRVVYWGTAAVPSSALCGDGAERCGVAYKALAAVGTEGLRDVERLPLPRSGGKFTIVASRSHLSPETRDFVEEMRRQHGEVELRSAGSSLKLCLVAEGGADVYPRLAPTMEWDTAAGDAVVRAAGGQITDAATGQPLRYNKEDLHNPHFVAGLCEKP